MNLLFHHLFVFVKPGAPVVDDLVAAGFIEGSRNVHPGQGTANRRIFFRNGMLEFIWVDDIDEVRSAQTAPTKLWERSNNLATGYAPFGIALCPDSDTGETHLEPFAGWAYRPQYLTAPHRIWNAANDEYPWEPMIFFLSFLKPYSPHVGTSEPTHHKDGAEWIEGIRIVTAAKMERMSDAATKLKTIPMIDWATGDRPELEVQLSGSRHRIIDLSNHCHLKLHIGRKMV